MMANTKHEPVHLLSIGIERHDVGLSAPMFVNGFEVDKLPAESWFDKLETKLQHYYVIHPYFLKSGQNELLTQYWVSDGREVDMGKYQVIFTVTDLDYDKLQYEKMILKGQSPEIVKTEETQKTKKIIMNTFEFKGNIPVWSWLSDSKIENSKENKKNLYAEYVKIWKKLNSLASKSNKDKQKDKTQFKTLLLKSTKEFISASEIRGEKYTLIDDMLKMASTLKERNIPVTLRELTKFEEVELKVFANGTRARLVRFNNSLFEVDLSIEYVGGAHDSKNGPAGENYSFWFKLDNKNNWIIDAVVPLGAFRY